MPFLASALSHRDLSRPCVLPDLVLQGWSLVVLEEALRSCPPGSVFISPSLPEAEKSSFQSRQVLERKEGAGLQGRSADLTAVPSCPRQARRSSSVLPPAEHPARPQCGISVPTRLLRVWWPVARGQLPAHCPVRSTPPARPLHFGCPLLSTDMRPAWGSGGPRAVPVASGSSRPLAHDCSPFALVPCFPSVDSGTSPLSFLILVQFFDS